MKGIKLKVWKETKRFLSMALSAALIVGTLAGAAVPVVEVQAAEAIATINEDFEDGKTIGYIRGEATKEVVDEGRNGGKALKVSNRGANWHTFSYNVASYAGMHVEIEASMKSTNGDAMVEVHWNDGLGNQDSDHYEWMIPMQGVPKDEWVTLSGEFDLPEGSSELYFGTGNGTADYLVDDVKITITGADPYYYGENLIKNPNFASDDLSDWQDGKRDATITTHTADEAIFDDVKTYATISDRTDSVSGNGECFQQDITDVVESGKTYKYSFWVKLDAEDYKDAPAGKREVCFAPGASGGTYWGSYSSGILDGNCVKTDITPGEWVKVEGEFTPKYTAGQEVFIRIIEQGTAYGANADSSVRGDYSVTGVSLCEKIRKAEPEAYAAADMQYEAGNTVTVNKKDGKIEAKIEGNYQTLYFKIPRTVNVKTLEEIEFEFECVSSNSVSVNDINAFGFKVLTEEQKADCKKEFENLSAVYRTNKIGNFDQIYEKLEADDSLGDLAWVAVMTAFPETLPADTWAEIALKNINFIFTKSGKENYFIEEDLKSLYQVVEKDADISMGVAVPVDALDDEQRMKLVYKHFNSVTCENEMKPESIFSGNVPKNASSPTATKVEDLTLNFANADKMMDAIVSENSTREEGDKIKVRGHVLVWHSQTPTWFFRENLRADGAYVSPEEMNKRMEWYIDAVLTHFDQYRDIFYAWDVVNEAANDAGGPRPNGDWYNVYGKEDPNSIEYITNAFKYADKTLDKLGDQDMILFYNDYNECTPTKRDTIVGYLKAIREVIGDRTLGAGMQGHHDMASPTLDTIEAATRAYAAVADEVHITELDIKSSMGFDGVDMEGENTKQGHRYKDIYNMVKRVNEDTNLRGKVTNITIWGTHDAASWLKTSNSVGGSADGKTPQFPLLFDDNLKAKPSYWAFVNQEKLESFINDTVAMNTDNFAYATAYEFKAGSTTVTMKPVWNNGKVQFQISLSEALGANDTVTVFFDPDNSKGEGKYEVAKIKAADFKNKVAVVDVKVDDLAVNKVCSFDVRVNAGGVDYSYNDLNNTQDATSKYFARVSMKPLMEISKGTIKVDGDKNEWANVPTVELNVIGSKPEAKGTAKVLWDEENLYVLMDVKDSALDATADFTTSAHAHDSMEVFIDELNEKSGSYDNNDKQYRVNYKNVQSFNGPTCKAENIVSEAKVTEDGYFVEAAIKWTSLKAAEGKLVGFDVQYNDAKDGERIGTANWYDSTGNGWSNPSVFGTAVLIKGNVVIGGNDEPAKPDDSEQDTKAANSVIDKIKAIGTVTYDAAVKAKIDEARKAYDALTDAQKKLVPADVLKILTDAEATYKAEAEKAEKEEEKKEEPKVKYFAKFSVKSIPIKKGQTSKALAKDIKIAKGDKVTKWTSSKPKTVSVDKKTGKIKGLKVGKAKITAYTKSGKKATITVVVQKKKVASTKITLTNKSTGKTIKKNATIKLKKGKSMTVVANVKPMTCTEKVTFKSSNKKVATVSSKGKIRAKKTGTTTITAKVGKKSIKFKVKVVKK